MVIRPLTRADVDSLLTAFNLAFSDYPLPFQLTREQLEEMLRRRGWMPEASVGAFEREELIAFTVNAVEGDRGYDTGTGVTPHHRRRGLARQLMLRSFDLLREHGCTTCVLEVLEENHQAAALYRSLGFTPSRHLQCWRFETPAQETSVSLGASEPVSRSPFEPDRLWWSTHPSWQNSTSSIARARDPHVTLGGRDGYAIVFPGSGDLPQLAVRPEARRRGMGTGLLRAAAATAGKPLRILNVDDSDHGIAAFLEGAGATRTVRQLEMVRAL